MEKTPSEPIGNENAPKKDSWSFREFVKFAAVAAVIVLPIRYFVAEPFLVRGNSMDATFTNNDYLIVEKINYLFNPPERGDVVIFRSPAENNRNLIKRIVGLPGEKIEVTGAKVVVTPEDGRQLELAEPYVINRQTTPQNIVKQLGNDEYFVLGDNRPVSYDSRFWGALPKKDIIGKPFLRLYNFSKIGFWPGDYKFNQ